MKFSSDRQRKHVLAILKSRSKAFPNLTYRDIRDWKELVEEVPQRKLDALITNKSDRNVLGILQKAGMKVFWGGVEDDTLAEIKPNGLRFSKDLTLKEHEKAGTVAHELMHGKIQLLRVAQGQGDDLDSGRGSVKSLMREYYNSLRAVQKDRFVNGGIKLELKKHLSSALEGEKALKSNEIPRDYGTDYEGNIHNWEKINSFGLKHHFAKSYGLLNPEEFITTWYQEARTRGWNTVPRRIRKHLQNIDRVVEGLTWKDLE